MYNLCAVQLVSETSLEGKSQPRFTAGCWNPHHNCVQIATANDTCIRGWDLRTLQLVCSSQFSVTVHQLNWIRCFNVYCCYCATLELCFFLCGMTNICQLLGMMLLERTYCHHHCEWSIYFYAEVDWELVVAGVHENSCIIMWCLYCYHLSILYVTVTIIHFTSYVWSWLLQLTSLKLVVWCLIFCVVFFLFLSLW